MADTQRPLIANAEVQLAAPSIVMERLCARFREFGDVRVEGACGRIETVFGVAGLEACDRCLKLVAEGRDDTALAYVKLSLAEHLLILAGDENPLIVWSGDGAAGHPLPYFREMRVVRSLDVTPHMRRITLAGEDLGRFATGGLHVRLLFPRDKSVEMAWPVTGEDGRPRWPAGDARPDVRIYTIRRIDVAAGLVDIDFVKHESASMPGARFASEARPGDLVGMTGPGGGSVAGADWYLLAGDETALPAISRIVETLPATAHAVVRIEVADAAEEQRLASPASLDIRWLHHNGAGPGTCDLLPNAVRTADFPDDDRRIFVWAGCEYRNFRTIREYLRRDRILSREEHLVVAYWRRGCAGDNVHKET